MRSGTTVQGAHVCTDNWNQPVQQGNIFTKQGFRILYQWCSPYMTVAIIHYCLGKRQHQSPRTSSLINHAGEVSCMLLPAAANRQLQGNSSLSRISSSAQHKT